jgi:PIN domain nuclease of toxin-antitoxin system
LKLLLDTHIWIWSLADPRRLKSRILKALENPANEKWISPISIWEMMVLVAKGRIRLNADVEEWIAQALQTAPLREAPLTTEVVLATRNIHLPHRDPADAFLAATAKVFGLTLVTADTRLLAAKGISFFPNR